MIEKRIIAGKMSREKLNLSKINSRSECDTIPDFEQSWVCFITDLSKIDWGYDPGPYAFGGVMTLVTGVKFNGHILEIWASDVQNTILPEPTSFAYMSDQMISDPNHPYLVVIENEFHVQWQAQYGPIVPSMSGKYMYVQMRLKNECDEYSEFITVGVHIDDVYGNINCPNC